MSGAAGPKVTLHTPFSPFVIAFLPANCTSTVTSLAFGANKLNVTVLSALTTGDCTITGLPPCGCE